LETPVTWWSIFVAVLRVTRLAGRAVGALLVAAAGAGGADDDHATAFAAVLEGGHCGSFVGLLVVVLFCGVKCACVAGDGEVVLV
jgi:hypothetical protein